jgi:hypothetical protein
MRTETAAVGRQYNGTMYRTVELRKPKVVVLRFVLHVGSSVNGGMLEVLEMLSVTVPRPADGITKRCEGFTGATDFIVKKNTRECCE